METIALKALTRNLQEENAADLRREDLLPIECYGHGKENLHLKVTYQDFRKAYLKAGESSLLDLEVDGKESGKVLVHDVQFDPISGKIIHVDLALVNMKEKITAAVPFKFEGIAPAVKNFAGIVIYNMDAVEVRCLPADLVHEITVDISSLEELHSSIKVGDLKVSDKIEILEDAELPVVSISTQKEEKTPEPVAAAAAEGAAPAEGEKKEGEGAEKKEEK